MKLEPKGNWIQVDSAVDNKGGEMESALVALPDDYKPAEKSYKAVSVAEDPQQEYKEGDIVVVPTHIIREVEIRDNKFYLVERNHIMAVVSAE